MLLRYTEAMVQVELSNEDNSLKVDCYTISLLAGCCALCEGGPPCVARLHGGHGAGMLSNEDNSLELD